MEWIVFKLSELISHIELVESSTWFKLVPFVNVSTNQLSKMVVSSQFEVILHRRENFKNGFSASYGLNYINIKPSNVL